MAGEAEKYIVNFLTLLFDFLAIFINTIFPLLTKILFIKYFGYLPDSDDDDEVIVIEVISLELGGDNNNNTRGLDTFDDVEVILISISIIYTYIFRNIYISIFQQLLQYHLFPYKLYTILHINTWFFFCHFHYSLF